MIQLSETAMAVLSARYLRRDESGQQVEDPSGMMRRVATAIAEPCERFGEDAGAWRERFLHRLERLEFLPNSPTLMNAGIASGQLAACFVLPIEDDLDSIFSSLGLAARIQQTGGGTGFSFSRLRPRGDVVRSTGGISSGPISFMELFDHSTAVIRAGGRRRGANMAVLRVDHPDILDFVQAKRALGRLENFNLSVGVTDQFFTSIENGGAFVLHNPRSGQAVRSVSAGDIFEQITESSWACGDPGLLFIDEINRHNPVASLGAIEATNPCGEQPLLPFESCTLGSINLGKFASGTGLNWTALGEAIRDAVVFLDNVLDANHYPAAQIRQATLRTRKIGLGVMGLADLLADLGISYAAPDAPRIGGEIARFMTETARAASAELGRLRGSFPAFHASVWHERGYPAMRNATVTCVAPTGTIGIIAGASGGIEPFFALAASRRILEGHPFVEMNPSLERHLRQLGQAAGEAAAVVRRTGSLRSAPGVDEELRNRFPIALEIDPQIHLRMQAAFQDHIDAAVSKTVNLPADAKPETVRDIFMLAHELRLKGVTIYRYGSRAGQTLSLLDNVDVPDCRECSV
jgi:ribonucleoside-diphosphate reductase alpha chain